MADTIRLNKVLRELNISIDRVAEFLESKGHIIEKRPTTKISADLYGLLCDEFQVDADKKLASKEAVEAKNKEKEQIREKQEKEQIREKKPEIIKASSKVVQFKKLGKIDLEPKNQEVKPAEDPKTEAPKTEASKTEASKTEVKKSENIILFTPLKFDWGFLNMLYRPIVRKTIIPHMARFFKFIRLK